MNQTWSISLAPWVSRAPGGHVPPAGGFRPRFAPSLQTTCECQRMIAPAGVGPDLAVACAPHRADEDQRAAGHVRVDQRLRPCDVEDRAAARLLLPLRMEEPHGAVAGRPRAVRVSYPARPAARMSSPAPTHGRRDRAARGCRARHVDLVGRCEPRRPDTGEMLDEAVTGGRPEASECCRAAPCTRAPAAWPVPPRPRGPALRP